METQIAKALLESTDAIVATDCDGRIVFWNSGAALMFGFSGEEAIGASLDLIIPEQFRARHWEGFRHVMETGESRYGAGDLLAVPAVSKGGRRLSIEFTIALLRDAQQRASGTVAMIRDVTKRFDEIRELRLKLVEVEQAAARI